MRVSAPRSGTEEHATQMNSSNIQECAHILSICVPPKCAQPKSATRDTQFRSATSSAHRGACPCTPQSERPPDECFHAQKHAHILNKSMPPRCTQLKIATRGEYRGARIWVLQSAHWRVTRPSDERIPYPDTHGNPGKHAQVGALPGLHACQPLPALRRSKRTRPARSLHHACIPWCACIPSASCASLCMWSLLQWSGESVAISHGTIFDFGEIWGMVTFPKSYKKPYLTERKMDKERLRSRDREKKLENVLEFLFFFSRQNLVLQNQWASDLSTEHMNDFPLLPKTL